MTTEKPLAELFVSHDELHEALSSPAPTPAVPGVASDSAPSTTPPNQDVHEDLSDEMRSLMDDLGLDMARLKDSSIFSGDEERFAFARALSRLAEMGSREWVERGLDKQAAGLLLSSEGDAPSAAAAAAAVAGRLEGVNNS